MVTAATVQVYTELARFTADTRLYALRIGDGGGDSGLLVEAFAAHDALHEVPVRDVIVLSTSAHLSLQELLGRHATLDVRLADGGQASFSGEVCAAAMLGSDGGLARYRLTISPWLWRLGHARNSRVWQDKTVIDIIDAVFQAYQPAARWRWSEDTAAFLNELPARSYCCQYREPDLDFVRRILAEEGLGWRVEDTADGHGVVLFADSTQRCAVPEDATSKADGAIRFHGARSVEQQDSVQALVAQRSLHASLSTVLSYDYKAKRSVAASSPTRNRAVLRLPPLESFDVPGQYAYPGSSLAQRYADLHMEGMEARSLLWRGRSTVRTLRAGSRMAVNGAPLKMLGATSSFVILRVTSVGVNNMPPPARHALAELFGPLPELLEEIVADDVPDGLRLVIDQAEQLGYGNCFEAVPADVVWRPQLAGTDGRHNARPTAAGTQTAIVIGADGNDSPAGADELHCDRLGRVRIRYHWQDAGDASCWVRVAQRSAGGGMGAQFLPRIGQEVLVQFIENDIDRPVIVGALYNGRGEGGVAPTPGGRNRQEATVACFERAHDHAASGQSNDAGGHSPVWHGASADSAGHRNAAAQWGVRSKEFGGYGYNQLLFDDTDAQGRVQLKSSHAASELNLGHLIHSVDNYRGSFRGLGAELRTDDYGALRSGGGLLVSSYKISHGRSRRDPAGENAAGMGQLNQAVKLAEAMHKAASAHQAVGLAAHAGAMKANASQLDDKAAPLKAMLTAVSGAVDSSALEKANADAAAKKSSQGGKAIPHVTDPIIGISAKDGLGMIAGQGVQLANGETVSMLSGQDTQLVSGGQMRLHTGQAIGVLGGAVKPGEGQLGLQLIAAQDAVEIQAQADQLKVQARDEVNVVSANAHIDWAAAKSISLSTVGGANITISGGNITVQCPGKITVNAGKKRFDSPDRMDYGFPSLPRSVCIECLAKRANQRSAFINMGG